MFKPLPMRGRRPPSTAFELIVLDEDGALGLATVSPQGLKVLAKALNAEHEPGTWNTELGTALYGE